MRRSFFIRYWKREQLHQAIYGNKPRVFPGKRRYQVNQQAGKRTSLVYKKSALALATLLPGTEIICAFSRAVGEAHVKNIMAAATSGG
jgi:hypothetical protein